MTRGHKGLLPKRLSEKNYYLQIHIMSQLKWEDKLKFKKYLYLQQTQGMKDLIVKIHYLIKKNI